MRTLALTVPRLGHNLPSNRFANRFDNPRHRTSSAAANPLDRVRPGSPQTGGSSMRTRARLGRLVTAAGTVLALALALSAPAQAATESMNVNLAATTGPSTGVGE